MGDWAQSTRRRLQRWKRRHLKRRYVDLKTRAIHRFRSYTREDLERELRLLGLSSGATAMMHSAFSPTNGFIGTPQDVIDTVLAVIGSEGNLLMPSMPYTGSAYDYLREGNPFKVKTTVSRMGIVTEVFRRRAGVVRSLNPVHPILAFGPRAEWLVARHETLPFSCGQNSPLNRMLELDARVVFLDVGFEVFTFIHYLEERFKDSAPVPVYRREPLPTVVVDANGVQLRGRAYVYDAETVRRRDFRPVLKELGRMDLVRKRRVGNSNIMVIKANDALRCAEEIVAAGGHFYGA